MEASMIASTDGVLGGLFSRCAQTRGHFLSSLPVVPTSCCLPTRRMSAPRSPHLSRVSKDAHGAICDVVSLSGRTSMIFPGAMFGSTR